MIYYIAHPTTNDNRRIDPLIVVLSVYALRMLVASRATGAATALLTVALVSMCCVGRAVAFGDNCQIAVTHKVLFRGAKIVKEII
jgi:hypothetical protein